MDRYRVIFFLGVLFFLYRNGSLQIIQTTGSVETLYWIQPKIIPLSLTAFGFGSPVLRPWRWWAFS